MGTSQCKQLAFLVLLIVTAFPHKYQTQTPNDFDDGLSTPPYKDKDLRQTADETSTDSSEHIEQVKNEEDGRPKIRKFHGPRQREIDDAVEYGLKRMHDLYFIKEPRLYKMGYFLEHNHPGYLLASFRAANEKALSYARYGYASIQARTKLAETYPEGLGREVSRSAATLRSEVLQDECPLQGLPRCPPSFQRYRTADGTCNNLRHPWRGASMLPMQRFLPPDYEDGIQEIRRSISGRPLPSARDLSTKVHRDKNREVPTITSMFMQWGQFLDHDIVSSVQARMFNRSVPRCCQDGGSGMLPPEVTHPECLPIPVSPSDWFLGKFNIRCIEFVRSAPTTRIDCDLGFREQISQVTAFVDASTVYGSDPDVADSLRLFRKGQLLYGRSKTDGPLQPPDPPGGELCRLGAVTTDCFRGGDVRRGDQPALTALHIAWIRYHNILATGLSEINPHWSDEKLYQEARRIVGALVQHITYREFLPIVLGREVIKLFGLELSPKGYFNGYSSNVNSAVANSFGAAAFRFGHSLVQGSFMRADSSHRILRNNVTLHEEQSNVENIWSFGSLDRLLLGLCNQPSQRRDEFISEELTNHLFQTGNFPFGMDLAAINIQRGRDHGLPSYTAWRAPCGLVPLNNWTDFEKVMNPDTVERFQLLYDHFDDIDLFSGGLAEKPVRGGIIGPTFACIIAQQFANLRKGDRFWYENGNFESSFTPAQLQQIRRVTFSQVLCKTLDEIETIQPFAFLSADETRNVRVGCGEAILDDFDLVAWEEVHRSLDLRSRQAAEDYFENDYEEIFETRKRKKQKVKPTTRRRVTVKSSVKRVTRPNAYVNNNPITHNSYKPFKVTLTNVSSMTITKNKYGQTVIKNPSKKRPPPVDGYLVNQASDPNDPGQYQVNINIKISPNTYNNPAPEKFHSHPYGDDVQYNTKRPSYFEGPFVTKRPTYDFYRPPTNYDTVFEDEPFATSNRPPTTYKIYQHYGMSTHRPVTIPSYLYLDDQQDGYNQQGTISDDVYYHILNQNRPDYDRFRPQYKQAFKGSRNQTDEKKFIKISSIQGQKFANSDEMKKPIYISVQQREGELELAEEKDKKGPLVQVDVAPSEIGKNQWKLYKENEKIVPSLPIFEVINFDSSGICANELPHPMNLQNVDDD